jgi:hypothetical protein
MRKYWGIALFVGPCIAGCVNSNPVTTADSLVVTTSLSSTTVRSGEPVAVTIKVENRGPSVVQIAANLCPEPFQVSNAAGTKVGPGLRICSAIAVFRELAAGEQFVYSEGWAGDAIQEIGSAPRLVAPGTYQIRARVPFVGGVAESPPISLQIVP